MRPAGCSAGVEGQHRATLGCTRSLPGPGRQRRERAGARGDARLSPVAPTQDEDLVALQEGGGPVAGGGHRGQGLPVVLRWLVDTDQCLGRGVRTHSPQCVDGPICKRGCGEAGGLWAVLRGWESLCPPGQAAQALRSPTASCHFRVAGGRCMQPGLSPAMPQPHWDPLTPLSTPSIRHREEHKAIGSNYSRQYHLPGDTMATQPCCQILLPLPAQTAPLPALTAALPSPLPCPPCCSLGTCHGILRQGADMGTTYGDQPRLLACGLPGCAKAQRLLSKVWAGITMCSTRSTPSQAGAGCLATLAQLPARAAGEGSCAQRGSTSPRPGCNRTAGARVGPCH